MTLYPEEKPVCLVENYVCQLYRPRTSISYVKDLRLWFKMNPKTSPIHRPLHKQTALYSSYPCPVPDRVMTEYASLRCHSQMVTDRTKRIAVMMKEAPATQAITELVTYGCREDQCSDNRFQNRKAVLYYSNLCSFRETDDSCENTYKITTETTP